jgi:Uma2 family endonuclease
MTALPLPPGRLLTIADYVALGEDDRHRWELQEGNLIMSPSPTPRHMIASGELFAQLRTQLPSGLRAVQDVDLDLQLAPERQPGTARRPDLVVVGQHELDRVAEGGGLLRAREAVLVVEIISPARGAPISSSSAMTMPTRVFRITGSSMSTVRSR